MVNHTYKMRQGDKREKHKKTHLLGQHHRKVAPKIKHLKGGVDEKARSISSHRKRKLPLTYSKQRVIKSGLHNLIPQEPVLPGWMNSLGQVLPALGLGTGNSNYQNYDLLRKMYNSFGGAAK